MSQPPAYNRSYSFTNFQTSNPTTPLPAVNLDIELNAIKATLDALNANLALIQNDDTSVKNASIGLNQLSAAALAGFNPPKAWVTGTAYTASPASTVFQSSNIYTCLVSHTSGVFATDLATGNWQLIFDLTTIPVTAASNVSVVQSGSLTTDVQGSLQALDTGKAASSHTHASTAISDSTADGRAFLTATLASQKTLLGLGSLAFLNSVTLTAITANLAFTGVISPAALVANTNDWAPTSLATAAVIKASSTGAINVTGLSGGAEGRLIVLHNTGSNTITLTSGDTNSTAANRFAFPSSQNITLAAGESISLMYDATASLWRGIGTIRPFASQAQAQAGADATTVMTPLQTNQAIMALNPFGAAMLHVRNEKTSGSADGTAVTGSTWNTVVLQTTKTNQISGASLASNQATLPAGTYIVMAKHMQQAGNSGATKLKLYDVTAAADLVIGDSIQLNNSPGGSWTVPCTAWGSFTLAGSHALELRQWGGVNGGADSIASTVEVYADAMFWKIG